MPQATAARSVPPATTGDAAGAHTVATGDQFGELLRRMREAGLFRPRPVQYGIRVLLTVGMLAAGWAAFAVLGNSWWQLGVAAFLGFAWTQTGFLGHDIGHRQVTGNRRRMDILGLLHGDLLLGFSYGWWVGHHNKHHSNPNHETRDTDITRRRVIFLPEHGRLRRGRGKQFIIRHQHVLFLPLLTLEGIGLRIASVRAVRQRSIRLLRTEAALLAIHATGYLTAVFWMLPAGKAFAFIAIHQLVFGLYIGMSFAPNHKGMPIQRDGEEWDWMTRQVVTSRNVRSSYLTDFLLGGLNYQIEHHLFPTMPRHNLRKARPITMQYCQAVGLPYHEVSAYRSVVEILGYLRRTSVTYQQTATS